MSKQIENLKKHIKAAFESVESSEFLTTQVEKSKQKYSEIFLEYMKKNPKSNFREWNEKIVDQMNINSTVPSEIQAIGITLLAMDALEHDITNVYVQLISKIN